MLKDASVSHLGSGFIAMVSVGNGRPSPPALLQEAFEILSRGNRQGFAVDAPEPSSRESAASHATAYFSNQRFDPHFPLVKRLVVSKGLLIRFHSIQIVGKK